jgi:chromosome segregation ATPase
MQSLARLQNVSKNLFDIENAIFQFHGIVHYFSVAKPQTLESRMMIIERRLGELETENAEKKDTITVLDSTKKNLEVHIKDKESAVNILSEEIDSLKSKIRYFYCVYFPLFLLLNLFVLSTEV